MISDAQLFGHTILELRCNFFDFNAIQWTAVMIAAVVSGSNRTCVLLSNALSQFKIDAWAHKHPRQLYNKKRIHHFPFTMKTSKLKFIKNKNNDGNETLLIRNRSMHWNRSNQDYRYLSSSLHFEFNQSVPVGDKLDTNIWTNQV